MNKKRIRQIHEAISRLPLSLKLNFSIANELRDKIRGQQNFQIKFYCKWLHIFYFIRDIETKNAYTYMV